MPTLVTACFYGTRDRVSIRGSVNTNLAIEFLLVKQAGWISQEMISIPRENYFQVPDYRTIHLRGLSLFLE